MASISSNATKRWDLLDPVQHFRFLLFPWLGFSPHVANDKLSRFGLVHE